jgi:hypothetical protein
MGSLTLVLLSVLALSWKEAFAQSDKSNVVPAQLSGPEISALIRGTLISIDNANLTGNYTVLRDLGSSTFKTKNTASLLSDTFRPIREKGISLSATILHDPRLIQKPELSSTGLLKVKGAFLTQPENVTFDLAFQYETGFWAVDYIAIGFMPSPKLTKQTEQNTSLVGSLGVTNSKNPNYIPIPNFRNLSPITYSW